MRYLPVLLVIFWGLVAPIATAAAAAPPAMRAPAGLSLLEIKITGNEFLMLQNNSASAISDLSKYWLYDFNNVNPLAAGVSSSTQQLPAASLGPGQTLLLSSGGSTCGAAVTAKLSISLTDAGGFLEVVQTTMTNGVLQQLAGDAVSWSSGNNNSPGMITNVPSSSADPAGAYYRYQNTSGNPAFLWQAADIDSNNSCQFNVKIGSALVPGPSGPSTQLLPGDPPPATFIQADDQQTASAVLPPDDIGLKAPQLNEILPNPASPQTDSEDEFIELYNSNDAPFDLSGFRLEVGLSTLHDYAFPIGTSLPPKSFVAFYSVDTGLAMSNSGGQAKLLDPAGGLVSQSDAYGSAKDGQAWALANGQWYWTTSPTPNAANIINMPLTTKSLSVGITNGSSKSSTKVTKPKAAKASKKSSTGSNYSLPPAKTADSGHLNLVILAVIGSMALIYGLYEYRHDLGNQLYRLRRYRAARRAARQAA